MCGLKTPLPLVSLFIFQVNHLCSSVFLSHFNCLFFSSHREQEKTTTRHRGLRLMERLYLWMEAFIWRRCPWIAPHNMQHRAAQITTQSPNTQHAHTECTQKLLDHWCSEEERNHISAERGRRVGDERRGEELSRRTEKTDRFIWAIHTEDRCNSNKVCAPYRNDQNT